MADSFSFIRSSRNRFAAVVSSWLQRASGSDFVRKVAETFGNRVLLIIIGMATSIMVARILGPEGRGVYAVAVAIGGIGVQFGNLGLHASNTYYVAKERSILAPLAANSILVGIVLGGGSALLCWAFFAFWPQLAPVHGILLPFSLLWIPFGLAFMLLHNLLLGIMDIRAYNLIELVKGLLVVFLIALLIVVDKVSVLSVFLTGFFIIIISLVLVIRRIGTHISVFSMPDPSLIKDHIGYGIKAYLSSFFAFMVLKTDLLLVNHLLGSEKAGIYSISVALANMLYLFPTVVGSIFFPRLCSMTDHREKFVFVRKVVYLTGAVMVPFVLIAGFVAETVIRILYGIDYAPSASPFRWLLPGIFIWSIEGIVRRLLTSDGFRVGVVYAWFFAFLINIGLNVLFIPMYGIDGAAMASSLTFLVLAVMTGFMVARYIGETDFRAGDSPVASEQAGTIS